MSGTCKSCSAAPDVRAKLEQAVRDGEPPKQAVKLAETMGLTISHMSIIRHWKNHVIANAADTKEKPVPVKKYDTKADMQPNNPLIINPDDIINELREISTTDEHDEAKPPGLLTDLLEQLVINTGLIAHKKMQAHMAGNSRFPNEEIKALISLIQLSTERPSTTRNPTISALSERLKES